MRCQAVTIGRPVTWGITVKPFICFTLGVLSGIATGLFGLFLFEQAVMDRDWFPRSADA